MTLRAVRGLPSLRASGIFPEIRRALAASSKRAFRVAHYSVQTNHVHLIVEADGSQPLARGMQGLAIRLAKAVNQVVRRRGVVWVERYHSHALKTPREVHHALVYVLLNGRKHGVIGRGIDPCSSGIWFEGWRGGMTPQSSCAPVVRARTWLLAIGWRRGGPISVLEAPAEKSRR